MKWWVPVIIALILIPCIAGATVTTIVETSLNSRVNTIDMSTVGNYTLVGTNDGNVTLYNTSGDRKWFIKLRKGDPVRKVVVNPDGNNFTAMTWGGFVLFGNAKTGATIAEFDGSNFSYGRFPRRSATLGGFDNVTDIDMTDDGTKWFIVLNNTFIVKSSVNETLAIRTVDRNAATLTPAGMQYGALDPDGAFAIVSSWEGNGLNLYKLVDNTSTWYQNYSYRRPFVVTGSTDGSLYGYPVNVTIYNRSGTSTGSYVYIGENRTLLNWNDIRFTKDDGTTLVQQWYRDQGTTWVNYSVVPTYMAGSTAYTFYLYFGNDTSERYSNSTTKVMSSSDYTGDFDFNTYSSITNGSFDAEQPSNDWGCAVLVGGVSSPFTSNRKCLFTSWATNWSWSRQTQSAASSVGVTQSSSTDTNLSFTLNANPNGSAYAWNLSFDFGFYFYDECNGDGSAASASYVYVNGTLLKSNSSSKSCAGNSGSAIVAKTFINMSTKVPAGAVNVNTTSGTTANAGSSVTAYSYTYIDRMLLNSTWVVVNKPSVDSWGGVFMREDAIPVTITTVTDTITSMDISWNNPYLAIGTSSTITKTQPSTSGFAGTTSAADAGDKPDVSIVDGGVYTVVASSSTVNIYTTALAIDGTYDASTFNDVDVASSNGLWAVAGDSSGKLYVFSKEGTSGWELVWDSTATSVVTAVSISSDGLYGAVGREDGTFIMYYFAGVTPTTNDFIQDVYIIKDGLPYIGATVYVDESSTVPYVWTRIYTKMVDSNGMFNFEATEGNYYRFNITGELDAIRAASSSHTAIRLYITTPSVPYLYNINVTDGSGFGNNSKLYLNFSSLSGPTTRINVTVIDINNNDQIVNGTANWTGYSSLTGPTGGVIYTFQSNHTYQVRATILYPSGFRGEYVTILVPKQISSESGMPMIATALEEYLDTQIMTALFTILLMIFAGLASFANAPKVAVGVVVFAAILSLTNVIAVPITVVMVAGGVAMLSVIARSVRS